MADLVSNELFGDEVPLTKLDENLDHPTIPIEGMTAEDWRLFLEDCKLLGGHDNFS